MHNRLSVFLSEAIKYLCIILFSILTVSSFLFTASIPNSYEIVISLVFDNPIINLLFLICFAGFGYLFSLVIFHFKNGKKIFLFFVCFWFFFGSLFWSWISKCGPCADGASIYYAVKQFALGDYSPVSYRDSYYSCYPFQLGLSLFYEIIIRLVHSGNYHFLQGINSICLVLFILSQYSLIPYVCRQHFSQESVDFIQIYYLFLSVSCLPLLMYGAYIYGEVPSIAFLSAGVWSFLLFQEHMKIRWAVLSLLLFSLGTAVRKNSLIFLIAFIIILGVFLLRHFNTKILIYSIALIVCTLSVHPAIQSYYSHLSGSKINSGVPPSCYLAMGLSETTAGPGWYSGYNFDTFTKEADYDSSLASSIGWRDTEKRLQYFSDHPAYAGSFLRTKFLMQWLNSGWAVFDSLHPAFGTRGPFVESCFSGSLYQVLIGFMSNYQMILYFLCLLSLIYYKKGDFLIFLVFPLAAFGGALFHLGWEASGRYIFPYSMLLLPNAAIGFYHLSHVGRRFYEKK